MGAGNYLPPTEECYPHLIEDFSIRCDPVYELVYVARPYEPHEDDLEDLLSNQDEFERALLERIDLLLPGSFYRKQGSWDTENAVLRVVLKGEYHSYYPLFVTPTHPLGLGHIDRVSRRLFDGLVEAGYRLLVRAGPWCSGEYQLSSDGKDRVEKKQEIPYA